jgi:GTP-binding protein
MSLEAVKLQSAKLKKASRKTPLILSSASGQGVTEVLRALFKVIDAERVSLQETRRDAFTGAQ